MCKPLVQQILVSVLLGLAQLHVVGGTIASWTFDEVWAGGAVANPPATVIDPSLSSATLAAVAGEGVIRRVGLGVSTDFFMEFENSNGAGFTVALLPLSAQSGDYSVNYTAAAQFGEGSDQWDYSLDGGSTWLNLGSRSLTDNFAAYSFNLPGVTVNSTQGIQFRTVFSGEDVTDFNGLEIGFTPVPEPVHYALAVVGLAFVGIRFGRSWRSSVRKA